jgi:solute carrier family 10 (sodium/bile acid cotransporter), member 7
MPAGRWLAKYWFMLALIVLALITVADTHEWTVAAGRLLKRHGGPGAVIFSIFFFSGLALDAGLLRKGLGDLRATVAALLVIFLFAPLVALAFHYLPLNIQILTGLYLVAAMPSTLSTGVVMTEAAGGNMAHALFVTILANTLAVFTIPVTLSLLLATVGDARSIQIDKAAIMLKIAWLVLVPLAAGVTLQYAARTVIAPLQRRAQRINQFLVLAIVWMAMCQSRDALVAGGPAVIPIAAVSLAFHLMLVLLALILCKLMRIGSGRRPSVVFMGAQKTLPLSIILQVTLFPAFGLALAVCVVHHLLHLIVDAYLVEHLK